jgi:hypothetical protein
MSDITDTIDAYLAMLNETDAGRRAGLIEKAWAPGGTYVDPVLLAAGHDALSDMVAGIHAQFPGQRFRRTSGIDAHHDQVRFAWEMFDPSGAVTVAGVDVGTLAPDGRLVHITGFFGDLPAAAEAA